MHERGERGSKALPNDFPKPYSRCLGERNLGLPARSHTHGISSSPLRLASLWQDSPFESCHEGRGRSICRCMTVRADTVPADTVRGSSYGARKCGRLFFWTSRESRNGVKAPVSLPPGVQNIPRWPRIQRLVPAEVPRGSPHSPAQARPLAAHLLGLLPPFLITPASSVTGRLSSHLCAFEESSLSTHQRMH